jgi:transposase-like protein
MHEVSTNIGGHLLMSDAEQKLRVKLVGRNGRRRYEAVSKERLIAACLESSVSVSRLALEHGVNANLLRKWIKKRTALRSASPSAFIPVQLEETAERALSRQGSMATVDLPATAARRSGWKWSVNQGIFRTFGAGDRIHISSEHGHKVGIAILPMICPCSTTSVR